MHEQFLLAALNQAWLGRGSCAPNPSVGAVAVHNGQIIAQTWHRGAGTPHAEQLLLDALPKNLSDITLYVTLEPCNHWGKTPPCVDAIINYGIARVVYGYNDPNPTVIARNSTKLLEEKGIEVIHLPLSAIDAFYQSYRHWTSTNKPWVTAKIAQSMDGMIAGAGGARVHLSNLECANFTHQQRLQSDMILTSARTVNQDDPALTVRLNGVEVAKPVAILDTHLTLNPEASLFKKASHCHIYYGEQYPKPSENKNCTYHAMPTLDDKLDLNAVIHHLGALGCHDVWVEAGGVLFSVFHKAGLVNKTYIYISSAVLGDKAVSAYHQADIFNRASHLRWQVMGDNVLASLDWEESLCLPA